MKKENSHNDWSLDDLLKKFQSKGNDEPNMLVNAENVTAPGQGVLKYPEQQISFRPETKKELAEQLQLFKTTLHPEARVIYYPSCNLDTTVSSIFPDARIIYVDLDKKIVDVLKEHNFEAMEADATQYSPDEQPDIVLLLNPVINPEKPASTVKENGYVICNNYHNTANNMHQNDEFELVGVVPPYKERSTALDTQQLEDYFNSIETDEEFKKVSQEGGNITYERAFDAIKQYGDGDAAANIEAGLSSVMAEYKNLLKKFENYISPHRRIAYIQEPSRTVILETTFPMKKGGFTDLFIFRKNRNGDPV